MRHIIAFLLIISTRFFSLTAMPNDSHTNLVLKVPVDAGMFAVFTSVLGALDHFEKGYYAGIKIDLNSGRYLDPNVGPNWWNYFFEPISFEDPSAPYYYFTKEDVFNHLGPNPYSTIFRPYELICKYIHVKPDIQNEVDSFAAVNFQGHYMIGVHHRGTDKVVEFPLVPYEKTYKKIKEVIKKLSYADQKRLRIYVATDDAHFLKYISKKYPTLVIHSNFARSTSDTPLHDSNGGFYQSPYQMGKEALLDCLLLSRCKVLIRPAHSCLSSISRCFNPYIKVFDLEQL